MKAKPVCVSVFPWLKANLGKWCLGVLTGQDYRALRTAAQCVELFANCDSEAEPRALTAFRECVLAMQPEARELAFHAIAHVLDWGDRYRLWALAGLPAFERVRVCAYGPGGRGDSHFKPLPRGA